MVPVPAIHAPEEVVAVSFHGFQHSRTRTTKVRVPRSAVVTWASGSTQEGAVRLFDNGASRDVLAIEGHDWYLLKVQAAKWAGLSNRNEAQLAMTPFGDWVPPVFGLVWTEHDGILLSVLVVHRCETNLQAAMLDIVRSPCTMQGMQALTTRVRAFYRFLRRASRDLHFRIGDLQWKNLGVPGLSHPDIVLLDYESARHEPSWTDKQRVKKGVLAWHRSCDRFLAQVHQDGALQHWHPALALLFRADLRLWMDVRDTLPTTAEVDAYFESLPHAMYSLQFPSGKP